MKFSKEFKLDKAINTKRLKIRHTREGHMGLACTIVQLWNIEVVHRVNVNNIVTLNNGGWYTQSTKITINTALKQIYGVSAPHLLQKNGKWQLQCGGIIIDYFNGMIIGGGSGAPYQVLNSK